MRPPSGVRFSVLFPHLPAERADEIRDVIRERLKGVEFSRCLQVRVSRERRHEERVMSEYSILRMAGRCANGAERDGGTRYHAVPANQPAGLCGARPGRRSAGWSMHPGDKVTCPRCRAKLARAGGAGDIEIAETLEGRA